MTAVLPFDRVRHEAARAPSRIRATAAGIALSSAASGLLAATTWLSWPDPAGVALADLGRMLLGLALLGTVLLVVHTGATKLGSGPAVRLPVLAAPALLVAAVGAHLIGGEVDGYTVVDIAFALTLLLVAGLALLTLEARLWARPARWILILCQAWPVAVIPIGHFIGPNNGRLALEIWLATGLFVFAAMALARPAWFAGSR